MENTDMNAEVVMDVVVDAVAVANAADVTTEVPEKVKKTRKPAVRKYANPVNLAETWSGRGRTPIFVKQALAEGKTLEDLRNPALTA